MCGEWRAYIERRDGVEGEEEEGEERRSGGGAHCSSERKKSENVGDGLVDGWRQHFLY